MDLSPQQHGLAIRVLASVALVWYVFIIGLSILGAVTVWRRHTHIQHIPSFKDDDEEAPGVTILRPLKGLDCEMESCLLSAFRQQYAKFEIIFCVESETDPAVDIARALIERWPGVDAKLLVTEGQYYGPNPKINNLALGYAQAKYDLLWVLDSNVWVSKGTLARSVAQFRADARVQVVHHLPLCISTTKGGDDEASMGAQLDEMFMLTSHSKFYTAINAVGVAPCVVGKSNMYRRSKLDSAVARAQGKSHIDKGTGIQRFAQYIAEDNMIAQCIWDAGGRTAMTCDPVVQPLGHVSLRGYWSRRVRWLRVRRYMVWAATMVEPTTECIVSGVYGTFGVSALLFGGSSLWSWGWFAAHVCLWCSLDYWHYHNLLEFGSIEGGPERPPFVERYFNPVCECGSDPSKQTGPRPLSQWLPSWVVREILALPIWLAAMSGQTIYWRNRPFRILHDLSTVEIKE